jgi:hypothetical protein
LIFVWLYRCFPGILNAITVVPDGRVERRERTIGGLDAGLRERVHQGRFARVGIADQRHGRIGNLDPPPALDRACAFDFAQAIAQAREALAHAAAQASGELDGERKTRRRRAAWSIPRSS